MADRPSRATSVRLPVSERPVGVLLQKPAVRRGSAPARGGGRVLRGGRSRYPRRGRHGAGCGRRRAAARPRAIASGSCRPNGVPSGRRRPGPRRRRGAGGTGRRWPAGRGSAPGPGRCGPARRVRCRPRGRGRPRGRRCRRGREGEWSWVPPRCRRCRRSRPPARSPRPRLRWRGPGRRPGGSLWSMSCRECRRFTCRVVSGGSKISARCRASVMACRPPRATRTASGSPATGCSATRAAPAAPRGSGRGRAGRRAGPRRRRRADPAGRPNAAGGRRRAAGRPRAAATGSVSTERCPLGPTASSTAASTGCRRESSHVAS